MPICTFDQIIWRLRPAVSVSRISGLCSRLGNPPEIIRFKARTADQSPIHVTDSQYFRRIFRFDRPAVENSHFFSITGNVCKRCPHSIMDFRDICERRDPPRPNRPDRLIGDNDIRCRRPFGNRAAQLAGDHFDSPARPPAPQGFHQCR